jgi:hypothetical protein
MVTLKIADYYCAFFESINTYKTFIKKCNNIIATTQKDVYLFGASYNTQFLIVLGLDLSHVSGVLDNCKEKQNKFLSGYELKIYEPKIIADKDCIVILRNGYYTAEITKQVYSLNPNTELLA